MANNDAGLERVISEHLHDQPLPSESVVVSIGKDGKPGKPSFWNRADFRSFRITNRRNKEAEARVTIPRLRIRDAKTGVQLFVDVEYSAWCDPNREEMLAVAIAKHSRHSKRSITDIVNGLIEDWLRTEIEGQEYLFLTSIAPEGGTDPSVTAKNVAKQAGTHLSLALSLSFKLSDAEKLRTRSIGPFHIEVFPAGFAKNKVSVSLRTDLRHIPAQALLALASLDERPSFEQVIREETIRVIEQSVSLDDLDAKPPSAAKKKLEGAFDSQLRKRGWQISNLDLIPDLSKLQAIQSEKVTVPFVFQLKDLPREWSGTISFLLRLENRAKVFDSGIHEPIQWARTNAAQTATHVLSSNDYESLLGVYLKKKQEIEDSLRMALKDVGYSLSGFNLTTDLPIEPLSAPIRTKEVRARFTTRIPKCDVEMTYFVEYQVTDLSRVRNALVAKEDVPARIAASVDEALRDQLRMVDPLDFYFHFEVAQEGAAAVEKTLLDAIRNKLDKNFGAQVRSALLRREEDDVFRKSTEMMQPARQGALPAFAINHPALDHPVIIQRLVFRVVEFSKDHFYQFVVTKPTIEQIADSVRTHCEQWLVDAEPNRFYRISNMQLLQFFRDFVVGRVQGEFGVTIAIDNFVLGKHPEVARPQVSTADPGRQTRFWVDLLGDLENQYRDALLGGDDIQASSVKEKIDQARAEIAKSSEELERSQKTERRQIARGKPETLMLGAGSDDDDEGAGGAGAK